MKDFDRNDVFSILNAKDARQYLGKMGYFACTLRVLQSQVEQNNLLSLDDVNLRIDFPFITNSGGCYESYLFFLPADKVREVKEMEYRPFKNQDEIRKYFNRATTLGCPLHLEHKRTAEKFTLMVTGFFDNGLVLPLYGALTWEQLFDMFILYRDGKQQPFGVLEE